MTDLLRLRRKLCRELAQSEHDARVHTRREARRLAQTPPALALRAIAAHADALQPRFAALVSRDQPIGLALGRTVGAMFSGVRHALFDRVIDRERSYRATLLGLYHGLDTARLLREVCARAGDVYLARFCDELVSERGVLLEQAQHALAWFADTPRVALRWGARRMLAASRS
jgi:hypothetical protein